MGKEFLIDTNAIIEFLAGNIPIAGNEWIQLIIEKNLHCISVINQIELLGFNYSIPSSDILILEEFIKSCNILPLTEPIVEETIALRKTHKIKLPDAIIAATAIVYDLFIVTRNTSDFVRLKNLNLVNLYEI
jgi:predicted nucleic acid-binding protein